MEEDKEADDGDDDLPPLVHRVGYSIGDNVVREVLCVPCMLCDLNAIANNEYSADEGKEIDQEDDILPSFINLNLNFDDEGTDEDEGIDPLELSRVTTEATSTTPLSRKSKNVNNKMEAPVTQVEKACALMAVHPSIEIGSRCATHRRKKYTTTSYHFVGNEKNPHYDKAQGLHREGDLLFNMLQPQCEALHALSMHLGGGVRFRALH
jgi:hypothetical protein